MEAEQTIQPAALADAPFNDVNGDIILQSSGAPTINFQTYKLFLTHASTVFTDMLTLPHHQSQNGEPPVVIMQENADDLESLLLFCHPGAAPKPPTSLEHLYRLYRIADKYMMDSLKNWLHKYLAVFMDQSPVGVYVLARKLGFKEEAKLAAKKSLS